MKFGLDWTQTSTLRGLVWVLGGAVSMLFLAFATPEKAVSVLTITGTVVGGLGLAVKD
jgi:hypothetical protein